MIDLIPHELRLILMLYYFFYENFLIPGLKNIVSAISLSLSLFISIPACWIPIKHLLCASVIQVLRASYFLTGLDHQSMGTSVSLKLEWPTVCKPESVKSGNFGDGKNITVTAKAGSGLHHNACVLCVDMSGVSNWGYK